MQWLFQPFHTRQVSTSDNVPGALVVLALATPTLNLMKMSEEESETNPSKASLGLTLGFTAFA